MNLPTICRFLVGLFCIASFSAAAQSVTLRYNPPTGSTWIRTAQRSIQEVTRESIDNPTNSVHEMVSRVVLQQNDDGYSMTEVCSQNDYKINGQPFDDPTRALTLGRTNVTFFSREGEIIAITGNEDLLESLKKIFPQKMHPVLEQQFEREAALKSERARWEMSTRRFVDKKVSVGDVWAETIRAGSEPTAETLYVLTRVHKIGTINGRTLVTIIYAISAQPGEVDHLDLTQPAPSLRQTLLVPLWFRHLFELTLRSEPFG